MPLMILRTNATVTDQRAKTLLAECSKKVASLTGKPEAYVMTLFGRVGAMTMAGTDAPACLVEIRGVGKMSGEQTKAISRALCGVLAEALGVESRRIYLNFMDVTGSMWGWDGDTFG